MAFCWRWLSILSVLLWLGQPAGAAPTRAERAYAAAAAAFHDGLYSQAEAQFDQFLNDFKNSGRVPQVVLLKAQAQFKQGKFAEAIATLSAPAGDWSRLADQYAYWLGEAQFAQGNFPLAAETFTTLAKNFPASPLRLTAVVEAAAAHERLADWAQLERLLGETNGVFALQAAQDSASELVARGRLLLAQARFAQRDFAGAAATLKLVDPHPLTPELDWQRASLLTRVDLAAGHLDEAQADTTNLLQLTRLQKAAHPERLAESVALRGTVLEQAGRWAEAGKNWQENLAPGVPEERQREAILKLAAAAAARKNYTNALAALGEFLRRFTNSPAVDLALLTQGELNLKQYAAQPAATNYLAAALDALNRLLAGDTNAVPSPLAGQAHLNRGWCFWLTTNFPASLADFQKAAAALPRSPDLAVAKFKLGDAQFALADYTNSRASYQAVLDEFKDQPAVMKALGDRALYQIVRTSDALRDAAGAERAVRQLLEQFPESELDDNALLQLGEGLSEFDAPTNALRVLREFAQRFPDSPLRPQVELETARNFEAAQNWSAAITSYAGWLKEFPSHELRPQVEYSLGWAEYQAGDETNALARFSSFVAQFPTNALAPRAQWWVADHFFRAGLWVGAETNYEYIFQNPDATWRSSELFYPAQLMAGRAAAGRLGFPDAANYLTRLVDDTNCPPALRTQALFAYGGVLMRMDSTDTNRPFLNFEHATNVFAPLAQSNPTNALGAMAWSELGDCHLQLGAFEAATNAYRQAMNSPFAGVGLRSRAQVGLGRVLEKMAEAAPPEARRALLLAALQQYCDVVYTTGPEADPLWVKKAGLYALPLMLTLQAGDPDRFLDRLQELLPALKQQLEKKRAALHAVKN